ncbi:MAG: hypothetical protein ACTHM8_02620 [Sphingomonas sp.]
MKDRYILAGLGLLLVSLASPAYAYLDGATGSMLLQAMIGGFATAMVIGRSYIAKAKTIFSRSNKKIDAQSED